MKNGIVCAIALFSIQAYADSRIPVTNVDMFQDRAFVTRKGSVKVSGRMKRITFTGLTPKLDPESVQVLATPAAGIKILTVKVEDNYGESEKSNSILRLERRLQQKRKEMDQLQSAVQGLVQEKSGIGELQEYYASSYSLNIQKGAWNSKTFGDFMKFLGARENAMHGKWRKLFLQYQQLRRDIEKIQAELDSVRSVRDWHRKHLIVDVQMSAKSPARFEVRYAVPASGWHPSYVLRTRSKGKNGNLEIYGHVSQKTGEDWQGVQMRLHGRRAPLRPQVPSIGPRKLQWQKVKKVETTIASTMKSQELSGELDHGQATEDDRIYTVARRVSVLSGKPAIRVYLAGKSVSAASALVAIPEKMGVVFNRTKIKNPYAYPLNPGVLDLYAGSDFRRRTYLNLVSPGEAFFLNTGTVHSLRVRRSSKDKKESAGFIGNKSRYAKTIFLRLENKYRTTRTVQLLVQLPESGIKSVEVVSSLKDKGFSPVKGKPSWWQRAVALKGGARWKVDYDIEVTAPKEFRFRWPSRF
jgi:uncharacterized protein (TIGR02231 family)